MGRNFWLGLLAAAALIGYFEWTVQRVPAELENLSNRIVDVELQIKYPGR